MRTEACPKDTILLLANLVTRGVEEPSDSTNFDRISGICENCILAFKKEKPFHHSLTSGLRLLRILVLNSSTAALMGPPMPDLNIIEKGLKAGYGLLSPAAMILGIIATVFLFFQRSWPWSYRLVPVVFLYGMLISPIGMRMCENQHLTTNQPLAVTLMVGLIYRIIERPKATNTEKTK